MFGIQIHVKTNRAAMIAITKTRMQRTGGLRRRPGRGDGHVTLGERGHLGIDIVQRCQRGLFFHQVVMNSVADQPGNLFLLEAFQIQLVAEQAYRQGAVRCNGCVVGSKADARNFQRQIVALVLEPIIQCGGGFADLVVTVFLACEHQ